MARRVSDLARRLEGGPRATELHDEARRRRASGGDIILLTVGDTDVPAPAAACAAATAAIARGRANYPDKTGDPALRSALAALHAGATGLPCDPSQVLVSAGAQQAAFHALLALVGPGDEVLLLDPCYPAHDVAIRACGAVPVRVPLRAQDGFRLTRAAVRSALTPRTRAFLFNTPHNPTGRVFDPAETAVVADACRDSDLWLLSDEVYSGLRYGKPFLPPASLPGLAARTVTVGSLSKSHAMTGWRVGYAVAPSEVAPHLARISACASLGVAPFVQDAALAALASGAEHVELAMAQRRARAASLLAGVPGLRAPAPESGPFLFLDVRGTGLTGTEFCWGLLDATGVAMTPGEAFGDGGFGHARMCLAVGDVQLDEACHRIAAHAERISRRADAALTLA